jgi:hypothetical protein
MSKLHLTVKRDQLVGNVGFRGVQANPVPSIDIKPVHVNINIDSGLRMLGVPNFDIARFMYWVVFASFFALGAMIAWQILQNHIVLSSVSG